MTGDFPRLKRALSLIDAISIWSARIGCTLTLVIMVFLLREIVGRYFFNAPTAWVNETNQYLLCILSMMGGAYCVLTDSHIRVDILWLRMGPRTQAASELLTSVFPLVFLCVITWIGFVDSWEAIADDKRSMSILAMPLWPSMLAVPVGTSLMILQFLVRLVRNVLQIISGQSEHPPVAGLID